MRNILFILTLTLVVSSCMKNLDAKYHKDQVSDHGEEFSLGMVQKNLKKGLSQAEVIEFMGSPNIVSTDEDGREVWVYDKISSESSFSGGNYPLFTSGAFSTSQKTTTVIVKFNNSKKVRDFAYHSSKF